MNESPLPPVSALPVDLALHLEKICTRFEDACKAGQAPRIEEYLGDTGQPERCVLLQELLRLELTYRRRSHETHTPEEYEARFPEHTNVIRAVFGIAAAEKAQEAACPGPLVSTGLELASAEKVPA